MKIKISKYGSVYKIEGNKWGAQVKIRAWAALSEDGFLNNSEVDIDCFVSFKEAQSIKLGDEIRIELVNLSLPDDDEIIKDIIE
jgi:hypothetical protein